MDSLTAVSLDLAELASYFPTMVNRGSSFSKRSNHIPTEALEYPFLTITLRKLTFKYSSSVSLIFPPEDREDGINEPAGRPTIYLIA